MNELTRNPTGHPENPTRHPELVSGSHHKSAFTLAEVLITLGVIGVVAAMTLPSLIQNSKEKETISKLKKGYSALSQAVLFVNKDYGPIQDWGLTTTNTGQVDEDGNKVLDFSGPEKMSALLAPYLNIRENCSSAVSRCELIKNVYDRNGSVLTSYVNGSGSQAMLALNDGTLFWFGYTTDSNADVIIAFPDKRRSIKYGVNAFYFQVKDDKVYPRGLEQAQFASDCLRGTGGSCGGWIIANENMDYLHCNDLSFNGKSKCD